MKRILVLDVTMPDDVPGEFAIAHDDFSDDEASCYEATLNGSPLFSGDVKTLTEFVIGLVKLLM